MKQPALGNWTNDTLSSLKKILEVKTIMDELNNVLFAQTVRYQNLIQQHRVLYPHCKLTDLINQRQGE